MKKSITVLFLVLMLVLSGCATQRNVVVLPTLELCPEPDVPIFYDMPADSEQHIGGRSSLDILGDNFNLLFNYSIKQKSTLRCNERNVLKLQEALSKYSIE